jgi:hypothetical protein
MIASGVIQDKKDSSIEDSREVKKIEAAADDKELDDETALDGDRSVHRISQTCGISDIFVKAKLAIDLSDGPQ